APESVSTSRSGVRLAMCMIGSLDGREEDDQRGGGARSAAQDGARGGDTRRSLTRLRSPDRRITEYASRSCWGPGNNHQQGDSAMRLSNKKGFTLIELLIVVVIIGILAAIAIPKFANTKEKAYVAAMKSDLRNMATAEESYFADNQTY